ncbi:MOSC domain-containing protein [Streptomyces sp. NPDC007851]|uniref:MOSC domain-containing protein n=1 Tax=Streptomyces sp. NPDC007851 TaxID=3155008 RepID=UPI0033CA25A4
MLVYQLDSYRFWSGKLGRDDLTPGSFGESFTVDGLPDDEVCIGDRYRVGGALPEVSQPRVTCYSFRYCTTPAPSRIRVACSLVLQSEIVS